VTASGRPVRMNGKDSKGSKAEIAARSFAAAASERFSFDYVNRWRSGFEARRERHLVEPRNG
jgi:hypothetical protein